MGCRKIALKKKELTWDTKNDVKEDSFAIQKYLILPTGP